MTIAVERLEHQINLLEATNETLSTNIALRLDGRPRGDQPQPLDTGAALYFQLKGRNTALACDKWDRVADNVVALAKHIEALRGIDRWGVGSVAQAFAGYQALPAPEQWWQVLHISRTASHEDIMQAYRLAARTAHPDHGGSNARMARLNAARDQAVKDRKATQ